jgi:uncharacterized protein with PQ loop repeat/ribosomal protein L40E
MFGIIVGIIVWIIFLVVCINIGKEKNRNGFLWGLFLGPFGLLILAILPKIEVQNTVSYNTNSNTASGENDVPVFMRNRSRPVSLSEVPKIAIGNSEEPNVYFDNDIKSNKWVCSKCGNVNKAKEKTCKKCGNEKGILKINK